MSLQSAISRIAADPFLAEFWAGYSTKTARPVQQFVSPYVDVLDVIFHYKVRTSNTLLQEPDFTRGPGDEAVEISLDALTDATVLVGPKAANMTLDRIVTENNAEYLVKAAIATMTDLANEDVERRAIRTAVAAGGEPTAVTFSQASDNPTQVDPIQIIDDQIEALLLSSTSQNIGIIFGVTAFKLFKRNPTVRAATKGALSYLTNPDLFLANSQYMTSTAFSNVSEFGLAPDIQFVFPPSYVLLFSRADELTENDPSFMKTFRSDPVKQAKNIGRPPVRPVVTSDGRTVIVTSDWSGEPVVTNEVGCKLLSVS